MKILIISHYFPPENSIASLRPYSWAKYWSKMGHNVTVLTTKKIKKDDNLKLDSSYFRVIEVNVIVRMALLLRFYKNRNNYLYTQDAQVKKKSLLIKLKNMFDNLGIITWDARLPNLFDFWYMSAYKAVMSENWDLTISTYAPYVNHLVANKLKLKHKTRLWIADYRDLWTQHHIYKGLYPFTLIEEYLENMVNTTADIITTVSAPLAKKISDKYKVKKVSVIENGFDIDDIDIISKERYWKDTTVRLVYTGSIHPGNQDPSPLFEAINAINCSNYSHLLSNLEVIFVGTAANLDSLIDKYQVNKWVKYKGSLPREDSLRMQRDAHALIFLEYEAPGVDGILTGKLFEYLCSGTEILGIGVTNSSSTGKLILGHGINVGKDSHLVEKYLINLLRSGEKTNTEINADYLTKYSRKKQAEQLLELVDMVN